MTARRHGTVNMIPAGQRAITVATVSATDTATSTDATTATDATSATTVGRL